jgi:hypothetical protein
MPHLNVDISQEAYDAAKAGSDEAGMLLRKWVERIILDAARKTAPAKERTLDYTEGQ